MRTILTTLLALGAADAMAAPITLDFDVTGISSGSAQWNLDQDLFDELNAGLIDTTLSQHVGNPALTWQKNGTSQLAYTNSAVILSGFPALAYRWTLAGGGWECDVGVSTGTTYNFTHTRSDSNQYGGGSRTLGTTLMHELGHCMGLGHVNTEYAIMGVDFTHVNANGNTLYFYQGEDAADKLVAIRDFNASFEDVGVVHWKYAGNPDGDAYSDHSRTVVKSASSVDLASYTEDSGDTPVFLVRQGQAVRPEFTYENNGSTNSISMDVDLVLSTNDTISSTDPVLGSVTLNLGRDDVYTGTYQVTVPSNTAPGRYTLGARITNLIGLTDDQSANNATYVDIDVLANGDPDYCVGAEPCQRFHGDCDSNADCATGLTCNFDVGPMFGFSAETDVCDLPLGDPAYCSAAEPCARHLGDCDSDSECEGDLTCIFNIGADYGWDPTVDVCGYPPGHANFCSWAEPCGQGEGDCDSDLDCSFGTCQNNVGAAYGYAADVDVCDLGLGG